MMAMVFHSVLASSGVISTLEAMRSSLVGSKLGGVASIAAAVAGVLCAIAMLRISHDYLNGRGITLWQVIRPIVLLMLCCNFGTFILGPVHSICRMMTNGMANQASTEAVNFSYQVGRLMSKELDASIAAANRTLNDLNAIEDDGGGSGSGGDDTGWLDGLLTGDTASAAASWLGGLKDKAVGLIGDNVTNFLKRLWHRFMSWVYSMITTYVTMIKTEFHLFVDLPLFAVIIPLLVSILLWIMKVVMLGQQILCYSTLTILSLLGPFSLSLSIMPGFEHTFRSWLARYIQVAFWIPVGQLIMWINYWMLDYMIGLCEGYDLGGKYVVMVALFVSIFNILQVPKISAYVIESGGDGGVSGGFVNGVRETVQTAGSVAAML